MNSRYDHLSTDQLADHIRDIKAQVRRMEQRGYANNQKDKLFIKELRAELRYAKSIMANRVHQPKLF